MARRPATLSLANLAVGRCNGVVARPRERGLRRVDGRNRTCTIYHELTAPHLTAACPSRAQLPCACQWDGVGLEPGSRRIKGQAAEQLYDINTLMIIAES